MKNAPKTNIKRVPKLRFPEFRKSGEWNLQQMNEVYRFIRTNSLSRDQLNYKSGDIRNIHYGDIHTKFNSHFNINQEIVPYISDVEITKKIKEENLCREGDIIFADASEDLGDIGKSIELINLDSKKVTSGLHTIHARLISDTIQKGFSGYLFKSFGIRKQIQKISQGTKVLGLSSVRLAGIFLYFPIDLKEQQSIAECLSSLDERIAAEGRKLDALKAHKKSLMQQLFPAEGETKPILRFPEFQNAGDWDEIKLGSLTEKVGSGITPTGGERNYKKSGRPFVRSQNIGWGKLLLSDISYIDEITHNSFSSTQIEPNDVLLNITGASIGRSAIADKAIIGGNVNQHVCIIRVQAKKLNALFLNLYLISQYGQKQINSFQAGGNRQGLNFAQIRSFKIPMPSTVTEQKKIAECLTSIIESITCLARKIEILQIHKKGLMQQLFPSTSEVSE